MIRRRAAARRRNDLRKQSILRSWSRVFRRTRRRIRSIRSSNRIETEREGFEPSIQGLAPYDGLANRCLQPLGHLSRRSDTIVWRARNVSDAAESAQVLRPRLHAVDWA